MNPLALSRRHWLRLGTTAAASTCFPFVARAQAAWPTKSIRLVVPFAPGGSSEIVARSTAVELSKLLGQSVFVENKPGGAGNVAMGEVARADDQHTLILGHIGTLAVNPYIFDKLPYDPVKSFRPISLLSKVPSLYVVRPDLPVKDLREFVALAKSKPGGLVLGSSGTATSGHLAAEMLKMRAGIDLVHVPYKGAAPALTDLVGGQVQVMVDNLITALPQVRAGRLRALAVTSAQRVPELPNVPTIAESGYPGFEVTVWVGLLAPAKTPPAVVSKLHTDIASVLAMPQVKQRIADMGGATIPMSPEQFGAFIRSEIDKWGAVVRQAGIKAE